MTDPLIKTDPGILGGTPVFTDTRVPVRILMEYLEASDRLDQDHGHYALLYHDWNAGAFTIERHRSLPLFGRRNFFLGGLRNQTKRRSRWLSAIWTGAD